MGDRSAIQARLKLKHVEDVLRTAFQKEVWRCLDTMEKEKIHNYAFSVKIFKNTPPSIQASVLAEFASDNRALCIYKDHSFVRPLRIKMLFITK